MLLLLALIMYDIILLKINITILYYMILCVYKNIMY